MEDMNGNRMLRTTNHAGLLVALGILLVVFGVVSVVLSAAMNVEPILVIGWFLLVAGLLQALHGFSAQPHRSLPLDVIASSFHVVAGVAIILYPLADPVQITFLLSPLLIVLGLFRLTTGMAERIVGRLPVFICGAISLYLGFYLWMVSSSAGLKVIGLLIGAELAASGWSLAMRGVGEKRLAARIKPLHEEQYP